MRHSRERDSDSDLDQNILLKKYVIVSCITSCITFSAMIVLPDFCKDRI
jgi:hypothetical protein